MFKRLLRRLPAVRTAKRTQAPRRALLLAAWLGMLALAPGCSISKFAAKSVADVLAEDSIAYAADEDIELIGDATPFALKTIESFLVRLPEHRGLLTAAAKGFTQYAYVYVQLPADVLESEDVGAAYARRARAKRLYLRARDYGLRGLGLSSDDALAQLHRQPVQALSAMRDEDVELLYWTGVAWVAAISLGKDEPGLIAGLPVVDAIIDRAFALDPDFDDGGLHTFLIGYETSRPGSGADAVDAARRHFQRAVALSEGRQAAPYVAMAESVAAPAQQRREYERLLEKALAVDPDAKPEWRLANLVMQRRARWLLDRTDQLFVE